MSRLTRPDLDQLPSYVPGRSAPGAIKLASNEVPYGPLPGVVEAITQVAAQAHRYPDMGVVALRDVLAQRYGVTPDRVVTGCGSVALTEHLAQATCLPGDEIIYSWRSFEAYPIIAAVTGATSVRRPNTPTHGHDLAAMAEAVTERTRMVLVCNPNNPTGTAVTRAGLDELLATVGGDVLVVLDEAYREFVTDDDVPDGLVTYGDRPNVVVLRTLSKAWGLAGMRVGFMIASPEVATAVRKVLTPFSTNAPAQAAALAALQAPDEMRRRCDRVIAERTRVTEAVRKLVPDLPASQANFVWLPLGKRSAAFATACADGGVLVRPFPGEGVRVTIGTPEENDMFLTVTESALAGQPGRRDGQNTAWPDGLAVAP